MKIAVLGAGNMGMAFSLAFVKKGMLKATDILLVEPRLETHAALKAKGFEWILSAVSQEITSCDLIVLAVKPQDFSSLASELKKHMHSGQTVLSIMAGIPISKINDLLFVSKVVRCMPNTPAQLGVGIAGYFCQGLSREEATFVKTLLECTGKAVELGEEKLLDSVTAISGSGPAYFYYFLQAMVAAGTQLGLTKEMAKELACETMLGAYHLATDSQVEFDELIKAVASKGGTTEAALRIFETEHVASSIEKGIRNAKLRAEELSVKN
jgi:pyrroline-5-carboxylate reductase